MKIEEGKGKAKREEQQCNTGERENVVCFFSPRKDDLQ